MVVCTSAWPVHSLTAGQSPKAGREWAWTGAGLLGQRAGARRLAQPVLGRALGGKARRRTPAARPPRPDLALHLPSVGQVVLGIPDRSAAPGDPKHVAADRPSLHKLHHRASLGDISGTRPLLGGMTLPTKSPGMQALRSAPERIRTSDLRFRRPALYPAELRALVARPSMLDDTVPAERAGFEPAIGLSAPYSLSRRVPSATRPPLREGHQCSPATRHNAGTERWQSQVDCSCLESSRPETARGFESLPLRCSAGQHPERHNGVLQRGGHDHEDVEDLVIAEDGG